MSTTFAQRLCIYAQIILLVIAVIILFGNLLTGWDTTMGFVEIILSISVAGLGLFSNLFLRPKRKE